MPEGDKHPAPASDLKILIIEDDHDTANSLREALEMAGYHQIAVEYGGRGGLSVAHEFRPDVVFCDIGLPAMDGYAVCRALRKDSAVSSALLVAFTGHTLAEHRRRALEAGFDCHLAKPGDLEALEKLLADRYEQSKS